MSYLTSWTQNNRYKLLTYQRALCRNIVGATVLGVGYRAGMQDVLQSGQWGIGPHKFPTTYATVLVLYFWEIGIKWSVIDMSKIYLLSRPPQLPVLNHRVMYHETFSRAPFPNEIIIKKTDKNK